jgi:hypothetical protein
VGFSLELQETQQRLEIDYEKLKIKQYKQKGLLIKQNSKNNININNKLN